jgi:hypothetical protein
VSQGRSAARRRTPSRRSTTASRSPRRGSGSRRTPRTSRRTRASRVGRERPRGVGQEGVRGLRRPPAFAKRAEGGAVSTPGSAADDHISTTTKVSPDRRRPAHETNSAKAGKEDKKQGGRGGTEHPASTENNQLDGHKYAVDANSPLEKLAEATCELGNDLCAELALLGSGHPGGAYAAPAQVKVAAAPAPAIDPSLAQQVGWEIAGILNGTMDKTAADRMVEETLEQVIKQASDDAVNFVQFYGEYVKSAEPGPAPEMPGGPGGGAGGPPPGGDPMAGGGGLGGPGEGPEAMMAALGGGGGGAPGGAPPGGPGGAEGGGGDHEAMMLAQILERLGVSPEELEQALTEEMGGGGGAGGGAPPPEMGPGAGSGGPAPGGQPGGGGMEAQAAAGRGKVGEKTAEMRSYITELISRSRAARK